MSKIRTLAESDIDHATRVRLLTDLASAGATLQSVLAREAATPPDMRSLEWHRWLIGVATYRTALAINMWIASLPDSDLRCALCTRDIQIPFVEAWINRSPGPEPGENAEQLTPLRECRELLVSALLEVCDAVSTNTTIAARMLRCARTLASAIARADADIKRFGEGAYEAYATGHASGPKFPTHLPRGDLPDLRSISAAELATARSAELGICCSYCDRAAAMRAAGAPESAATRGVPPIDQPDIREAARFTAFWEPYIPKVKELFDEA